MMLRRYRAAEKRRLQKTPPAGNNSSLKFPAVRPGTGRTAESVYRLEAWKPKEPGWAWDYADPLDRHQDCAGRNLARRTRDTGQVSRIGGRELGALQRAAGHHA